MHYDYQFKRKAVELYRQGLWPNTPDGLITKNFHSTIRKWVTKDSLLAAILFCLLIYIFIF